MTTLAQNVDSDWPLAEFSRTVSYGGVSWHVQQLGAGPILLLLHGTGASTHSWRDVATELAKTHCVVMCDLPGHGFTSRPRNSMMSLKSMASLIDGLLKQLEIAPDAIVGHSAGSAIACQLVLDKAVDARCIVSINGALLPFEGIAGQVFSPIARLLAVNPVIPKLVSWRAQQGALTRKLLDDTGSKISPEGRQYYQSLLRKPEHVAGALAMMANWDLVPLARRLPQLTVPLHLVVGTQDKTVSPTESEEVSRRVKSSTLTKLDGLGHLAHEEQPLQTSVLVQQLVASQTQESHDLQASGA